MFNIRNIMQQPSEIEHTYGHTLERIIFALGDSFFVGFLNARGVKPACGLYNSITC